MTDVAIRCEGLAKQYRIGERESYKALRDVLTDAFASPFRRFRSALRRSSNGSGSAEKPTIWALNNVSFEIKRGEVVGIIGRNGAGKSTLLKILSRITEPTRGYAEITGRVGSLLEVGTGFHPELTGRENIFLNGAILGMRKSEIARKFDEIVAFAEVEDFIDTPVKRYSSGMYVRLAFAVAAHMDTEILLVDEVLAVGDLSFQKKCLGKIGDVAQKGRTVVLVSHNMASVESMCSHGLLLERGELALEGPISEVVQQYTKRIGSLGQSSGNRGPMGFDSIKLQFSGERLGSWSACSIEAEFYTKTPLFRCFVNLVVDDLQDRHCIHLRTDYDGLFPDFSVGRFRIKVDLDSLNLEAGTYSAWFRLVSEKSNVTIDSDRLPLRIEREYERFEGVGSVVAVRHHWSCQPENSQTTLRSASESV
jgi:ABC-type polysaccharide/polyol phosphate transport system ATPase subunit